MGEPLARPFCSYLKSSRYRGVRFPKQRQGLDPWLQWTWAWFSSMVLLFWASCSVTIITDFSGIDESGKGSFPGMRHPSTRGWTNPSYLVNGWDVCRETLCCNGQLRVQTYLRNTSMSSWEYWGPEGFYLVLKCSFSENHVRRLRTFFTIVLEPWAKHPHI